MLYCSSSCNHIGLTQFITYNYSRLLCAAAAGEMLCLAAKRRWWVTIMITSSTNDVAPGTLGQINTPDYFQELRSDVDPFVAKHFSWTGTLRHHLDALGWGILRDPINVVLSPVFVLTRIATYACRRIGWRRGGEWLARCRILLRTSVARRVETCIVSDLLGLPVASGNPAADQNELERAILAAPQFREILRQCESANDAQALSRRVVGAVSEYSTLQM
jgi:hypothetical protein